MINFIFFALGARFTYLLNYFVPYDSRNRHCSNLPLLVAANH